MNSKSSLVLWLGLLLVLIRVVTTGQWKQLAAVVTSTVNPTGLPLALGTPGNPLSPPGTVPPLPKPKKSNHA